MKRRRRSPLRSLLTMITIVGVVAAGGAGVIALRDYLESEPVVLSTSSEIDPNPPAGLVTDAAATERIAPLHLRFDDVNVDEEIRPVGIEEDGELEIPDEDEIGWWEHGSAPGLPGATVLAAHVSWNHTTGPFNRLGRAEIGERLEVDAGDGTTRVYQVVERTMYPKDGLPQWRIWRTTGPETLVLITCGGSYNSSIRRYRDNIVVYAVPIASYDTPGFGDETDDDETDDDDTGDETDDVEAAGVDDVGDLTS
jgi:Sortase domain